MIVCLPGVYRPQDDTSLLVEALNDQPVTASTRVLDLCAGSGALSIAAAKAGAGRVLAIDISRRSIVNIGLNRLLNDVDVEARRGDLIEAARGELFDLVVSNPPYVPSTIDALPTAGRERAWNGGTSGRILLDRIIASAPEVVAPGGSLLLLQSALCDVDKSIAMLAEHAMPAEIIARRSIPFGPVLRSRRAMLEHRGFIERGEDTEELVVLRASKALPRTRGERNGGVVPNDCARGALHGGGFVAKQDTLARVEHEARAHEVKRDVSEYLREQLIAMGFRILDTVSTRTDTKSVDVFSLAPEGRVIVTSDSHTGRGEIGLHIEHVGHEVADYLQNHLPESVLCGLSLTVELTDAERRSPGQPTTPNC